MADADSSLTPEKRLLKLIEEPQSEKSGPPRKGGSWKTLFSPAAWKVRFGMMKEGFQSFLKQKKFNLNIRTLNGVVTVATVMLVAFFLMNTVYEIKSLNTDALTEQLIVPTSKMIDMMPIEIKEHTTSLLDSAEEERNVFLPFGKRTKETTPQVGTTNSLKLVEMTKDLKLTGISYNPEMPDRAFCMIEDLSKSVTLFLRAGDHVLGMKVQKINPNTVVLEYQEETIEIR